LNRCDHSAAIFNHTRNFNEVILFGGCIEWIGTYPDGSKNKVIQHSLVSQTTVLQFSSKLLFHRYPSIVGIKSLITIIVIGGPHLRCTSTIGSGFTIAKMTYAVQMVRMVFT
jgi:hypothetical protein